MPSIHQPPLRMKSTSKLDIGPSRLTDALPLEMAARQ
jgi:hypothetical protein